MTNQLIYNNNWEYDTYLVNNRKIATLTKVEINGKEYEVTSHKVSVPYNDMGHSYQATSVHYFVKETVFGTEQKIDLNKIVNRAKVIAIEFTTQGENNDTKIA